LQIDNLKSSILNLTSDIVLKSCSKKHLSFFDSFSGKKVCLQLLSMFLLPRMASATIWYVDGKGSDFGNGKTVTTAFRTLQKAADLVLPGDVVLVGNGRYTANDKVSAVLTIRRSGRPGAWITWKARSGHHPEVRPVGWTGIHVLGSYHVLDGITVLGNNDSIALAAAEADAKKSIPNPYFNTNGILFDGRSAKTTDKPHHLIVRHCTVAKCAGGGISGLEIDYLTVEDCDVFDNAWFMRYAGSGITTLNNWAYDQKPGYHIIVQRNRVWNNKTQVKWERTGQLSDGNGILLDITDKLTENILPTNPNFDAQKSAVMPATDKATRPEWKARALIANNVSVYNGGSGIHTFHTKHVDIVNNTTYHNGQMVDYAELFANCSEDVFILNNIIVPKRGGKVTQNYQNKDVRWDYNLYSVTQQVLTGTHDLIAAPQFVNAQANVKEGNFQLTNKSKGRETGTNQIALKTDLLRKSRPQGSGRDRGAYEQ
jgi:hypothetical protein